MQEWERDSVGDQVVENSITNGDITRNGILGTGNGVPGTRNGAPGSSVSVWTTSTNTVIVPKPNTKVYAHEEINVIDKNTYAYLYSGRLQGRKLSQIDGKLEFRRKTFIDCFVPPIVLRCGHQVSWRKVLLSAIV